MLPGAAVTLNLKKGAFSAERINYLAHIKQPGGLELSNATIAAVRELKYSTTQTEMSSVLDLCNMFRRLVLKFSTVAASLNKKLRSDQSTTFPSLFEAGNDEVKNRETLLTNPPVLAFRHTTGRYTVKTDAGDYQLRCVLPQQQEKGTAQPIRYWSCIPTSAEQKLETTDKECLAVVRALSLMRSYLRVSHFIIRTEHKAIYGS